MPSGKDDRILGSGIVALPSGDFVLAGAFEGEVQLGAGVVRVPEYQRLAFVGRYAPDGVPRWIRVIRVPPISDEWGARSLAVDREGNVFFVARACWSNESYPLGAPIEYGACGNFSYLYALRADGSLRFEQSFGAEVHAILPDEQGGIFVTGKGPRDLADESGGYANSYIVRYGASGQLLFELEFESKPESYATSLAAMDDETIAVGGVFTGRMTLGPTPISAKGNRDLFVARIARDGGKVHWVRTFGSPMGETYPGWTSSMIDPGQFASVRIAALQQGRLFIAGVVGGNAVDFGDGARKRGTFALVLGPRGESIWSRSFDTGSIDPDKHYGDGYVVGAAAGKDQATMLLGIPARGEPPPYDFGDGKIVNLRGTDTLLLTLDTRHGRTLRSVLFHGDAPRARESDVNPESLSMLPDGTAMVTGWFTGTIDFGGQRLEAPGEVFDVPDRCKSRAARSPMTQTFFAMPPPLPCPSEGWSAQTMFVVRIPPR